MTAAVAAAPMMTMQQPISVAVPRRRSFPFPIFSQRGKREREGDRASERERKRGRHLFATAIASFFCLLELYRCGGIAVQLSSFVLVRWPKNVVWWVVEILITHPLTTFFWRNSTDIAS